MIWTLILCAAMAFVIVRVIDEPRRHARYKGAVLDAVRTIAPGAYGVAIMDQVRRASGLRISAGRLYLALDDLEEEGAIYGEWGERRFPGGPRRWLYFARSPDRNRRLARA